jgi:hypothetical protein
MTMILTVEVAVEINLPLSSKSGSKQIKSHRSYSGTEDSSYDCRSIRLDI